MADDSKILGDTAPKRKPPAAGKGRPKGATNKLTRTIKAAIEEAFDKVGGAEYLAKMAYAEPVAFMTLLGKILPTQLEHTGKDGASLAEEAAAAADRIAERMKRLAEG